MNWQSSDVVEQRLVLRAQGAGGGEERPGYRILDAIIMIINMWSTVPAREVPIHREVARASNEPSYLILQNNECES